MKKTCLAPVLTLFFNVVTLADVEVIVDVGQTDPKDSTTGQIITKLGVNETASFSVSASYNGKPPLNAEEKVTGTTWTYTIYVTEGVTCSKSSGNEKSFTFTTSADRAQLHQITVIMKLVFMITKYKSDMTTVESTRQSSEYSGSDNVSLDVWNKLSIDAKKYIPLKSTLNPDRYPVTVTIESTQQSGEITLTASDKIKLFENSTGGNGLTSHSWSASVASKTLYVQGFTTNTNENDQKLTASFSTANVNEVSSNVTVVEVNIVTFRWLADMPSNNKEIIMSYAPSNLTTGVLELTGDKDLFTLTEDTLGFWIIPLTWNLPNHNNGDITIYANAAKRGDGKLKFEHSTSGAKAEEKVGVYGVDIKIDGIVEQSEIDPGAFLGIARRKTMELIAEPVTRGGNVTLELSSKLKLYDAKTGGNEITARTWSANQIPSNIYVEGTSTSSAMQDQDAKLKWDVTSDNAKATIIDGMLLATSLSNSMPTGYYVVTDKTGEGAYVHWNIDNDDNSATVAREPAKHPGGDYKQNYVANENDLLPLLMEIGSYPILNIGNVKLTIGSNAKIWKSAKKGPTRNNTSNLVINSGSKSWNFSNSTEKNNFNNLATSLFVEGINSGQSEFKYEFIPPAGSTIELDKIKYNFIAANCGQQPSIDRGSNNGKAAILACFPKLIGYEWSIIGPTDDRYNCIAYSVGLIDRRVYDIGNESRNSRSQRQQQPQIVSIDRSYSNGDGILQKSEIDEFFWREARVKQTFQNDPDTKIIYYSGYHAAKSHSCNSDSNKWKMFESKCGELWILEHRAEQIGGSYGSPLYYYK
jgi:hypothetical protein